MEGGWTAGVAREEAPAVRCQKHQAVHQEPHETFGEGRLTVRQLIPGVSLVA